jgi:TPP-dependent pyruvate/acetoin dehydrogenase alpha subunit
MPSSKESIRPKSATTTPAELPHNGFSLISNEKLIAIYTAMLRCRLIVQHSRTLAKSNLASRSHASTLGREAAAVGVSIDLRRTDRLACVASAHAHPSALYSIRPKVPVIEDINSAIRFAIRQKQKKSSNLVAVFSLHPFSSFDEGQLALQQASDQKLPILFVAPAPKPLRTKSRARTKNTSQPTYSFPTFSVDGNDAVAVYRVATESIFHARKDHGASLIECVHTPGSDPLRNMENYLRNKSLYTPALKRDLTTSLRAQLHPTA